MKVGLVIGRFQVPELTLGHTHLLYQAHKLTDRLIIMLGTSVTQTKRNPLSFELRKEMVAKWFVDRGFNDFLIFQLNDHPSNEKWVKSIEDILRTKADAWGRALYVFGSRDSCLDIYKKAGGQGEIVRLDPHADYEKEIYSGSDVRLNLRDKPTYSKDFRSGVIYSKMNEYPRAFPCIDVLVWRINPHGHTDDYGRVEYLLARKSTDEAGKWRLIGGFVDPTDYSLEDAAKREVREEADIEIGNIKYEGSSKINDWRYRKDEEGIISAFFSAQYVFGNIKPKDDIAELKWFELDEVKKLINPTHKHLLDIFLHRNKR